MKAYKKTLIITILITLLPCFVGLLLWDRLPEQIPTHFNFNNEVDGYSSKPLAVFGIPLMMVFFQLVCAFATFNDPKKKHINSKLIHLILFIIPGCSVFIVILSYGTALGYPVNTGMLSNLMVGLIFLVIGNYMPKVKQNYTMGIKLPWTLDNEQNWNKTHRLAGWLWIIGGILLLGNAVLRSGLLLLAVIFLTTAIPGIYSFLLYQKEKTN